MAQGYAAPTFALNGGRRLRASPIPLRGGIKAHTLCEENARLRHMRRLIKTIQRVTILLSRACLYPPSEAARPSSCLRPVPMRCLSYVHHDPSVMYIRLL
jgi:hypothetical protein